MMENNPEEVKTLSDLKVTELRKVLVTRGLDGNGVKATLVSKLEKALTEQGIEPSDYYSAVQSEINGEAVAASESESLNDTTKEVVTSESGKDATQEEPPKQEASESAVNNEGETELESDENVIDNFSKNMADKGDDIDQEELDGDADIVENDAEEAVDGPENTATKISMHEISDVEDIDEMMTDELADEEREHVNPEIEADADDIDEKPLERVNKSQDESQQAPKFPSGLQFPKNDPQGKRCIWIRGIPIATRISDLKQAFALAGFKGEAKIFLTKHASRPTAFGFMVLESEELAKGAVHKMDLSIFKGKTITVERACDSAMLHADSAAPPASEAAASERQRVHPPIKPPEKEKKVEIKPAKVKQQQPQQSPPDDEIIYIQREDTRGPKKRRISPPPYNRVQQQRMLREQPPPRRVIGGPRLRVVANRSPDIVRERRVPRSPPPMSRREEDDRIADERRRFHEELRRKEEEFARRERALRAEAEANKMRLQRERLERENLELKLKLQQQEREREKERLRTPPRRKSPPPKRAVSPLRRPITPVQSRRPLSPVRNRRRTPPPPPRRSPIYRSPRRETRPSPKDVYPPRRDSRNRSPLDHRSDGRRPGDNRPHYDYRRRVSPDRYAEPRREPPRVEDRRISRRTPPLNGYRPEKPRTKLEPAYRDVPGRGRPGERSDRGQPNGRGRDPYDAPIERAPPRADSFHEYNNYSTAPSNFSQHQQPYSSASRNVGPPPQSAPWPSIPSFSTPGIANPNNWNGQNANIAPWSSGPFSSASMPNPNARYRF